MVHRMICPPFTSIHLAGDVGRRSTIGILQAFATGIIIRSKAVSITGGIDMRRFDKNNYGVADIVDDRRRAKGSSQ
jgi:hypothetical protein